jgi:hypothetical protein
VVVASPALQFIGEMRPSVALRVRDGDHPVPLLRSAPVEIQSSRIPVGQVVGSKPSAGEAGSLLFKKPRSLTSMVQR